MVLGVYYKLQTFLYLTANGIVQGIRPLIGYNYGAGGTEEGEEDLSDCSFHVGGYHGLWNDHLLPDTGIGCLPCSRQMRETIRMGEEALRIISLGFFGVVYIYYRRRGPGGPGKGIPISFDFPSAVPDCYDSSGFSSEQISERGRSLACFLGDRVAGRSGGFCDIQAGNRKNVV